MRVVHHLFSMYFMGVNAYVYLQLFAFPPFLLELGFQPLTLQTLKASGVPTGLTQRSSKWLCLIFISGCWLYLIKFGYGFASLLGNKVW